MTLIVEHNHDSSTTLTDHYDVVFDPDGALAVTAGANLGSSTYGIDVDFDAGTSSASCQNNTIAYTGTELRVRHRFDMQDAASSSGSDIAYIVKIYSNTDVGVPLFTYGVVLRNGLDPYIYIDYHVGDTVVVPPGGGRIFSTTGDHCLSLRAIKETTPTANDGELEVFLSGTSVYLGTNLANNEDWGEINNVVITFRTNLPDLSGNMFFDELWIDNDESVNLGCGIPVPPVYTLSTMNKPVDIDADGSNTYISLLKDGLPILVQFPTSLDTDGTVVFEPGTGSNIGVQCGRQDSDIVYVGGDFGSTFMELSSNGGSSFSAIDTGTGSKISSFIVGDTDNKVLVAEEDEVLYSTHSNIQETSDSGTTWTERNASVPEVITDISRKDISIREVVFGSDTVGADEILYSANSGVNVEGYSTGFPVSDVTKVIVL